MHAQLSCGDRGLNFGTAQLLSVVAAKALARVCICAGLPKPLLAALSDKEIFCPGSFIVVFGFQLPNTTYIHIFC